MIFKLIFVKIVCYTILYMIFYQYDWEPVLIHSIVIGFEAILEENLTLLLSFTRLLILVSIKIFVHLIASHKPLHKIKYYSEDIILTIVLLSGLSKCELTGTERNRRKNTGKTEGKGRGNNRGREGRSKVSLQLIKRIISISV